MVYVRLERDWTDTDGSTHAAGAMVDVDVSTLARLESQGLVADPASGDAGTHSWINPTGGGSGGNGNGDNGSDDGNGSGNGSGGGNDDGGNGSGGSGSGGSGGDSWINPTGGDQSQG